jgi:cation diffusion facilitator family transporter
MSSGEHSSIKAILYAFLANLGIALAKTWAAMVTGSGSMLAEAIHSYADSGNQVLLYIGLRQSARPADSEHPLGYGKLSYFWSFIVALMLFSMGGLFSIYEGWHKLHNPEILNQVWIAIVVLALSIVLESFSLYGCLREIRKVRGDTSLRQWIRHTRNAELMVVLGEDTAALLGLAIALGFLLAAHFTGDPLYDALGSIAIGIILIIVSIFIAIRLKSLIVGRSADPELQRALDRCIANSDGIDDVLNIITLQMGPKVMLAAKLKMKPGLDIEQAVDHINKLEAQLKESFPEIGWCFMEPDTVD